MQIIRKDFPFWVPLKNQHANVNPKCAPIRWKRAFFNVCNVYHNICFSLKTIPFMAKSKIKPFRWMIAEALQKLPTIRSTDIQPIQGDFKDLGKDEAQKLVKSIESYGFFVPVFLWINPADKVAYSLDGHQRCRVINEAYPDGKYVPYVSIEASTINEAKKKLLLIDSKYGKVTKDGYDHFIGGIEGGDEFIEEFTTYTDYLDFSVSDDPTDDEPSAPKGKQVKDGFALEVTCRDEEDQQKTFDKLISLGMVVKILTI